MACASRQNPGGSLVGILDDVDHHLDLLWIPQIHTVDVVFIGRELDGISDRCIEIAGLRWEEFGKQASDFGKGKMLHAPSDAGLIDKEMGIVRMKEAGQGRPQEWVLA
jgi:hypothetical protein